MGVGNRIVSGYCRDQALEFGWESWAPEAGPPAPEEAEGFPVPPEEGRGLDDRQSLAPSEAVG